MLCVTLHDLNAADIQQFILCRKIYIALLAQKHMKISIFADVVWAHLYLKARLIVDDHLFLSQENTIKIFEGR